ncbi:YggT family protein [Ectothiorhodospiraceae bacterium BW-2]|nr:YggT family protein [Ectothiorhodospiraceae bacterium BW-2]
MIDSHYLLNPLSFLITTLFSLYLMLVVVRFLLQLTRADFYNPISQFIVKLTSPLLIPLRRFIPGWQGIDSASIVLMLLLQGVSTLLLVVLSGQSPTLGFVIFWSVAELISTILTIFVFAIIIQAIMSWVNPAPHYNPISSLLYSLTEPLLGPARRRIPPISGIDLSPLAVILLLEVVKMLLIPPFKQLALG